MHFMAEKKIGSFQSLLRAQSLLVEYGYKKMGENEFFWEINMGKDENGNSLPSYIAEIIEPPKTSSLEYLPKKISDGSIVYKNWNE